MGQEAEEHKGVDKQTSETKGLTPLMQQYNSIKSQYPTEVLFFRLGDFYEMFDTDAQEVSRLLNLTLTKRGANPMCGIPYHASRVYIARLLRLGKKIAICEQVTLPSAGKGIVERKVVEVITPGTVVEHEFLEQNTNNFLAALCFVTSSQSYSYSYIDVSTGDFYTTSWSTELLEEELSKELGRSNPRELLVSRNLFDTKAFRNVLEQYPTIALSCEDDWRFSLDTGFKSLIRQFQTTNLHAFSLEKDAPEIASAGCLLDYVIKNSGYSANNSVLAHIKNLHVYKDYEHVLLDDSSRRNLELTCNLRDGTIQYSLLETVLHTKTAMGSRLLRYYFMYPSISIKTIQSRQNHVASFVSNQVLLQEVRNILSQILDIERLVSRIALDRAHAKDLQALKSSLQNWLDIRALLQGHSNNDFFDVCMSQSVDKAQEIIQLIFNSIIDDPSTSLTEGNIIKPLWSTELDNYRSIRDNFAQILEDYIEEEKTKTGIQNLKIRYNRNIGYYLEVTKGKLEFVPEHFILRRTMVNGDRYTTLRLQELEQELLSADSKIIQLEHALFLQLRTQLSTYTDYLLQVAKETAYIDTIASFSHAAILHNWICPELLEGKILDIKNGRHPVVEMHLPSGEFIPNDTHFEQSNLSLITGPNMAGKSTYLRQNALIVFLAQIGSFIPASAATIGIVDRIFCRVGASDNLARGESTFLVEMSETALILRSATENSLIIMDEVGRGTSTEDGLSIAWAICEYLLNNLKSRAFFATHYHELTRIVHPKLQLLCLHVLEREGHIVFTKKISNGASENSYGLHVARLAGIPTTILDRAQEILDGLQYKTTWTELPATNINEATIDNTKKVDLELFKDEELVLNELLSCNVDALTPLEALQLLARWKKSLSTQ